MKKILNYLLITVVLALGCCFSACSKKYSYSFEELYEGLQSCELVYVNDNCEVENVLVVLEQENTVKLLNELTEFEFGHLMPPDYPIGYCIKLNYENYYWLIGRYRGVENDFLENSYANGVFIEEQTFNLLLSQYVELSETLE